MYYILNLINSNVLQKGSSFIAKIEKITQALKYNRMKVKKDVAVKKKIVLKKKSNNLGKKLVIKFVGFAT